MNDNYSQYQQESVFDQEPQVLQPVSRGIRFANFIIDMLAVYALVFTISLMLTLLVPAFGNYVLNNSEDLSFKLLDRLITGIAVALIFTIIEGATNGRSLGKLITRTVAVREDGAPFTWTEALKRSFSRIVPFEPLSALSGYPWHDKWSGTIVVKK